jgi:uncharacterized cupin superfamily protein
MNDVVIKNIGSIEPYQGPHAIPKIRFRSLRSALGVSAWGMNLIEFDPGATGYPEHDHEADGQEEVYMVVEGSIELEAEGKRQVLKKGDLVRVGPHVKRKFVTQEHGAVLLAIGGTPGKAYESSGL